SNKPHLLSGCRFCTWPPICPACVLLPRLMLTLEIMKSFASLRFGWIAIALAAACGGTPNEDPEASEIVLQPDARAGGVSPVLGGCAMFPADNPWNQPIDDLPVHPSSEAFIASI